MKPSGFAQMRRARERAGFENAKAAAVRWRVSLQTVKGWCRRGLVPGAKLEAVTAGGQPVLGQFAWLIPVGAAAPVVKRGRPALDEGAKRRAAKAVRVAIVDGRLIRPQQCSRCGEGGRIEGHHHKGYAPEHQLDVVWLCKRCHYAAHPRDKAAKKAGATNKANYAARLSTWTPSRGFEPGRK